MVTANVAAPLIHRPGTSYATASGIRPLQSARGARRPPNLGLRGGKGNQAGPRARPHPLGLIPGTAGGATLESVGTFEQPVFVTSHPDDPDLLYVVEKAGRIQAFEDGETTELLDISDRVNPNGEMGLLSIALDPGFATNGRFYTYGVSPDGEFIEIDEYTSNGSVASRGSRRSLLRVAHPIDQNHNGGQLQIGPDGYLYAGLGDGGGSGDPRENGQDPSTLLGSMVRIDPDPVGGSPYGVPADNPFVGVAGSREEIWSYGLRNPYRFSFDRSTGDLTIGDVGQNMWEEVDFRTVAQGAGRGDNFGWDCREGANNYDDPSPGIGCSGLNLVDPVFQYSHAGGNCSITGGYVSRDPGAPQLAISTPTFAPARSAASTSGRPIPPPPTRARA